MSPQVVSPGWWVGSLFSILLVISLVVESRAKNQELAQKLRLEYWHFCLLSIFLCNVRSRFMALKWVAKLLMAVIHRQSDENENQGIRLKVDTEIYPVMSLTFIIDI